MGREKDRLIEEEERGWYSVSRRLVCDSCVQDDFLSQYIRENGKPAVCDYCGADPEEDGIHCIPFDDLMHVIGDAINWGYASADHEGIPYESAEGGYAFPQHMLDTYDLVVDDIGLDVSEAVLEDVLNALPHQTWCRKGFWSLSLNDALRSGWEAFVEKVKYETRYLFTLPEPAPVHPVPAPPHPPVEVEVEEEPGLHLQPLQPEWSELPMGDSDEEIDFDRQEGIPAYRMLDAIGKVVRRFRLIQHIESGTVLYRVRVEDKSRVLAGPGDFGPPTRELATRANRMSSAGIVMFYGAMDRATGLVETFQPDRDGAASKSVWVAAFEVVCQLRLLDLTDLPVVPSLFDADRRHTIDELAFLHGFVHDLVRPIERDGREHIDYVPTQIVTEYFRHRFRLKEDEALDGILYRSSKRPNGVACVLFIDATHCGVETEVWYRPKQFLRLLEDRTQVLDGAASDSWYPAE